MFGIFNDLHAITRTIMLSASTPWAIKTCHFAFVYIFANY